MLLQYLKSVVGQNAVCEEKLPKINLPIYLKRYQYSVYSILGKKYLFVESQDKVNLKTYKKQVDKIGDLFHLPVVLVLKNSFTAQRTNLIENRLMFVEVGKQLFLPLGGIILKEDNVKFNLPIEKFTPQMQLCALFFLYLENDWYSVKEIAEKTSLNAMAISRGMQALVDLDVLQVQQSQGKNLYRIRGNKKEFFGKIEKLLIRPVQKEILLKKESLPNKHLLAGYSGLSQYSMLVDNEVQTFAVDKKDYKQLVGKANILFEDLLYGNECVKVQVWKYSPHIFGDDNVVDKISLCLSMENLDERTESVIEKLKEEVLNG